MARWVVPFRGGALTGGLRTLVMGVLNVTPDSFSDGGRDPGRACMRGIEMIEAGADILDVGGESTRPGAGSVPLEVECGRILPVIEALAEDGRVPISVDTTKAEVARRALRVGAAIVNDVSALGDDPEMARVVAGAGAAVVLMHRQGTSRTMQDDPRYEDLMGEVCAALEAGLARARAAGVPEDRTLVDPGIGFGKTVGHNLELLDRLPELRVRLGRPVLVGVSRKSFLGYVTGRPVEARLAGTLGAVAVAVARGADVVRVHDVAEAVDVVRVADAITRRGREEAWRS